MKNVVLAVALLGLLLCAASADAGGRVRRFGFPVQTQVLGFAAPVGFGVQGYGAPT